MRWGFVNGEPSVAFVQSSNAADLQARLVALLAAIGEFEAQSMAAIELGGAGDGFMFTIRVEYAPSADVLPFSPSGPNIGGQVPGGLTPPPAAVITPAVYMADSATELAAERTRYYTATPFPATSLMIGSEAAGASQGQRMCVLELIAPDGLYTPAA